MGVKIGFDLDRVLFDTNSYFRELERALNEKGTSLEVVFAGNYGRKDLDFLYGSLVEMFGKEEAERIAFGNVGRFINRELASLMGELRERGDRIYIITVGGRHQKRKAEELPARFVLVKSDYEKAERAASLRVSLFVDDKASVVEEMRARGISAVQAAWYLDETRPRMPDALSSPGGLRKLLLNLGK